MTCGKKMDAIGGLYSKWSKSGSERQRPHVFFHIWKIDSKEKHTQNQAWSPTNSYVEHVGNSGTTPCNSGKEGKEERMIEHY
jgi:hypothetical protein